MAKDDFKELFSQPGVAANADRLQRIGAALAGVRPILDGLLEDVTAGGGNSLALVSAYVDSAKDEITMIGEWLAGASRQPEAVTG